MSPRSHQNWRADDRGAVAPLTALMLVALFGFGALVTDVGLFQLTRRQLQTATDSAALAATYSVSNTETAPGTAKAIVLDYLSQNGFATATFPQPITGTYCPELSTAPAGRFTAGSSSCPGFPEFGVGPNAVQVSTSMPVPLFLGRVLLPGQSDVTVTATATAAQIPQAGFYADTGLVSVNGGIANAILQGALGANISLSAVQYNGLLNANVTALSFFNALATNIGVSAGTYSSLLQSNVTVQQILQAQADALNAPGSVAAVALNSLAAQITGSPTVTLGSLFDLGVWQDLGIGSSNPPPALNAMLNAYQLATLSAEVANGQNAVKVPLSSLGIPGIATVTAAASVIEPPVTAPFVFGPIGMSVHTAQVRLQLTVNLLSGLSLLGLLGTAPISLPLYIEVAPGEAQLKAISCGYNPGTDATVTIAAASGAAAIYLGTVTTNAMSNFSVEPTVSPATLVNFLGLTVTGSAEVLAGTSAPVQPPNLSPTLTDMPLPFTQSDIANGTSQSLSSSDILGSLLTSLLGNTTLNVSLVGLPLLSTGSVLSALKPILENPLLVSGLDNLLNGTLAALGIQIGTINVTVTGVRCGNPVLVN